MNILTYATASEAAKKLAIRIKDEVDLVETYHLALSGGVSAVTVYQALVAEPIDWKKVHLYFAYEVVIGPRKGYNLSLAKAHLIDKIPIHPSRVHTINLEKGSPEEMAEGYIDTLKEYMPFINGFPRFDMVLMDLYDDGHTLGLFPGDEELYDHSNVYHSNRIVGLPDAKVITLGFEALGNVKSIVFYAFGQHLMYVVGNIVNLMPEAKLYPANYVISLYPWTFLYSDAEAMREKSYAIY